MKRILSAGACAAIFITAAQAGPEGYVGEVFAIPSTGYLRHTCPEGSRLADGAELSIAGHQALYVVIGDEYGGDRGRTFKLPDLRDAGPAPKNGPKLMWCIVENGAFPPKPY